MSLVLTCNECGQPIDATQAYYTAQVSEVTPVDPANPMPPVMQSPLRLDWHPEHLPTTITERLAS